MTRYSWSTRRARARTTTRTPPASPAMTRYSWSTRSRPHTTTRTPPASPANVQQSASSEEEDPPDSARSLDKTALFRTAVRVLRMPVPAESTVEDEGDDNSTVGYLDEEEYYVPPEEPEDESAGLLMHDELNTELRALQREVAVNKAEWRSFERTVLSSRRNRKASLRKLDRKIDTVDEEPILPQDTYSFFAITRTNVHSEPRRCPELTFGIALFVLLLQVITLTFLAVDVIDRSNKGNPLKIPPGVDWTVQVCQLIALFITVITQDEVRLSLNVLFDGYNKEAFEAEDCHSSSAVKWNVSACLRLSAGIYSLALTFMLIISSGKVRDLLLNFSAVEFISNVDDTIFLLSKWGYFGPRALSDADVIANAKQVIDDTESEADGEEGAKIEEEATAKPHCSRTADGSNSTIAISATSELYPSSRMDEDAGAGARRCRCSRRSLILLAIWLVLFGCWLAISLKQGKGLYYLKRMINVQFGDESMDLETFSGLYTIDTSSAYLIFGGRKSYVAVDGTAKFKYCSNEKIWTFSYADTRNVVEDPCDTQKRFVRAQSAESDVFDLSRKPMDTWYYRSNGTITKVLPLSISPHISDDCGSHGSYSKQQNRCICDDGWFGWNCRFGSCQTMQIKDGISFDVTRPWSTRYTMLRQNTTAGPPIQVYGRPVFVGNTRQGKHSDVLFFTGRRWVLTHTGRFELGSNSTSEADVASIFNGQFHGHWSEYKYTFMSEPVEEPTDLDSTNEAAMPTGLAWFRSNDNLGNQVPSGERISDDLLACTCEINGKPFSCQNGGVCQDDGTCECLVGSTGDRCETSVKGNGFCNKYFNTLKGNYDGGDCCNATCTGKQYLCGSDERGNYIGFPHCIDPSQTGNGICDLSLNTKWHGYDGGDCCRQTCGDNSNCGLVSEAVFGGPYYNANFTHCHDPSVIPEKIAWANITIVIELGPSPENVGFHFKCADRLFGDSLPGTFNEPLQHRAGMLSVPRGEECNLVVKGNNTNGRFKVYYGDTAKDKAMLLDDRNLAIDTDISFSAMPPRMVELEVQLRAHRDDTSHPVRLGLLCTNLLQTFNESALRELDFDNSGNAYETVTVRKGSMCQFDEKGKEEYALSYSEGATEELIFKDKRRDEIKTTVFFMAVPPKDMVRVVAKIEPEGERDSGHAQVSLRCHDIAKVDEIDYASGLPQLPDSEALRHALRHVFFVPHYSQCLFTMTDCDECSYQLFYGNEETEDSLLVKSKISYSGESVFFETSSLDNVTNTTILYKGLNRPGPSGFDLRCTNSFPQDHIEGETRAIVLVPKETNCSFTMTNVDTSDPLCSQGEGYYRVYNGLDTSTTDKLLERGSQIEDETVLFVAGASISLLNFTVAVNLDSWPEQTRLKVFCDHALKLRVVKTFKNETQSENHTLKVREGASCELTFSDSLGKDSYKVRDEEDGLLFEGVGSNTSDKVFFVASSRFHPLVPITLVLEQSESQVGRVDDVSVELSCDDGVFYAHFHFINERLDPTHTFQVPKGSSCDILLVNVGNNQCCEDKAHSKIKVLYGTNTTANDTDVLIASGEDFACRKKLSFNASAPVEGVRRLLRRHMDKPFWSFGPYF